MTLAPIDITHRDFKRQILGYNMEEVTEFLRVVASQMEELIRERNLLRDQVREKELSILDYKDRDQVLKNTITTAQQMSERIREDSEKEARLIIHQAQSQADVIVSDSRESLKQIYSEISDLRRIRMQFESNLRAMAQAHIALLDQGEKYMPDFQEREPERQPEQPRKRESRKNSEISPLSADV